MKFRLWLTLFAALFSVSVLADEASVKRAIEARFTGIKVQSVTKTSYLGLYEVVVGDDILYTDEKVNYVFNGSIIDAKTRRDLTEERKQKLSAIKFSDLPLDLAIKQVRGNGKKVVAVFSDPNCPYCKRLDGDLMRENDITIYVFLYPILRADSTEKSRAIWCSTDRGKAYYDLMLSGREPAAAGDCNVPVEKWLALGRKLGISATPTSFTLDGQRIMGARSEELMKLATAAAK